MATKRKKRRLHVFEGNADLTSALFFSPVPNGQCYNCSFHFYLGRYVDKRTGMDVLGWAAHLGRAQQVETIMKLTAMDIDFLRKDNNSLTALHHAVQSGNVKAVQPIVEACARYKISIDICDKQGITPYIQARKLGYLDIAELLVNTGRASTFQSDGKFFKSADDWAKEGIEERRVKARTTRSSHSRSSLRTRKASRLPTVIVTTSSNLSYVVDLRGKMNSMGHSQRDFDIKFQDDKSWEPVMAADAALKESQKTTEDISLAMLSLNDESNHGSSGEMPVIVLPKEIDKSHKLKLCSGPDLPYLMNILSEQSTDTFRKGAKVPEPPKPETPPVCCEEECASLVSTPGPSKKDKISRRGSSRRSVLKSAKRGKSPSKTKSPKGKARKSKATAP